MIHGNHSPLVIKIGGASIEDKATAPKVWNALAQLHNSRTGGVVVVHGGGNAVDRHLDRLGFKTQRVEGIRITPAEQVDEIAGVLAGRVNKAVVRELNSCGVRAVGLCLGDGNAFRTVRTRRYTFDAGRVGDVAAPVGNDGELIKVLLANHYLPVLSSIGMDDQGFLNVNADDAAAAVARTLKAAALVLLTDVPGIYDSKKQIVRELTPLEVEVMIQSGQVTGGMIVKARAAATTASETGVPVLILSGSDGVALNDWVAGHAVGTRIVSGK
ncbi:MAG: acetylglutamate kinase [Phycisphaerales bacterium]